MENNKSFVFRPKFHLLHLINALSQQYACKAEVELFLNGKSQGRRKKEHSYDRLTWDDVRYEPGELKAIAYKEGKQWAEQQVKTTGQPAALSVNPEKKTLRNTGKDLFFVRIDVVYK